MSNHMRTYRGWSSTEDAKLVEALVNMVNVGGFKSDNGFKPGYLLHLEQSLKETLPESGILGKPHIESRIKTMKKDWQAVYDMLNATSGFGYDKERNCVTTSAPGVWESYLENHKWAAKWMNKKLPHYEELCVIFGKDRAQGNRAKSVIEMEEEVNNEENEQEQEWDDDFIVEMEDNCDGNNFAPSVQVEETSSVRTRKRKDMNTSSSMLKSFNDAVSLFADRLKESSKELSEGIKFELDMERKKAMITHELSKMTSMTQVERFKAMKKIKSDQDNVISFWDLNEKEREDWVRFIIEE